MSRLVLRECILRTSLSAGTILSENEQQKYISAAMVKDRDMSWSRVDTAPDRDTSALDPAGCERGGTERGNFLKKGYIHLRVTAAGG